MTQFKDKYEKENVTNGLFNYPILMAADILLYDCKVVPVGIDQKQHLELARDMVLRFNHIYSSGFTLPEPLISKTGFKIKSLDDPLKKMSKSDKGEKGIIYLLDKKEDVFSKISRSVTDGENKIKYDEKNKPGVSNLINIYSCFSGLSIEDIENKYIDLSYKDFKDDLGEIV
jgi:tryptophanyl-tRNA synthetase